MINNCEKYKVTYATIEDRTEIHELWNNYILRGRFGHDWEAIQYHAFGNNEKIYENCIVIRDGDIIVSAIALIPMTLKLIGEKMPIGVITGVVTRPEYRCIGLMTKLMNYAIVEMEKRKYILSILWGYRDRYARFGYEICGRQNAYYIPKRKFENITNEQKANIHDISTFNLTEVKEKLFCEAIHLTIDDLINYSHRVFKRALVKTYIYYHTDHMALVTVNAAPNPSEKKLEVLYKSGNFEGVLVLLSWLMADSNYEECIVYAPSFLGKEDKDFYDFYEWLVTKHMCNIRINNFKALMNYLAPYISERIDTNKEIFELSMRRDEKIETRRLNRNNTDVPYKYYGEYSDIEMVRIIFGPERPCELPFIYSKDLMLTQLFPIPFYLTPFEGL